MPSLSDTLDRLEHESIQISRFASENDRPPGPFTSAFLNLPTRDNPRPSILSLIRDSDESERRPFRDVNEDEYLNVGGPSVPSSGPRKSIAPGGGRGEGAGGDAAAGRHLLTPLRDLARKRNTPGELEATLTAADKVAESLADSSWRMSRAQDRVASLMEQHARQADRIAAVERSIAEFNAPKAKEPDEPSSPTPAAARELPPAPPPLSVDEALKAEEEALKALEAAIAPVRRAAALRASAQRSPKSPKSPLRSSALGQSQTTPRSKGTAAQPRTPAAMPVVTNSLVQGTPRDHLHAGHGHGARFSPLALLGTPRAPLPPPSALKSEQRSIFGPPRKTITPARHGLGSSSLLTPLPPAAPGFLAQSVLGPSSSEQATPAPPALSQPTPVKAVAELAREQTPARPESGLIPPTPMPEVAVGGPIKVEGVEIELACVGTAVVSHTDSASFVTLTTVRTRFGRRYRT